MRRAMKNLTERNGVYYYVRQKGGLTTKRALGRDRKEAQRQRDILSSLMEHSLLRPSEEKPPTVAEFSERWLAEWIEPRRNGKGPRIVRQRLRDHILPVLGRYQLADIKPPVIRALSADLMRSELAPQTVHHILADVRCLLRFAYECEILSKVPSFSRIMPSIPESAPKRLLDDELETILAAATPPVRFALLLAVLTGLRWGELLRLRWFDVKEVPYPHLILTKTKSGKVRRVPLSPEAVELLRAQRAERIIPNVLPFRAKHIGQAVRRIAKKTGIRWHLHMLRHTFACRYMEAGGNLAALQQILGHSTIRMTERYARMSDDSVFADSIRVAAKQAKSHPKSHPSDLERVAGQSE